MGAIQQILCSYPVIGGDSYSENLVANGTFDNTDFWTLSTGMSISGGVLNLNMASTLQFFQPTVFRDEVQDVNMQIDIDISAGEVQYYNGTSWVALSNGANDVTYTRQLSTYHYAYFRATSGTVGTIDNIIIREVLVEDTNTYGSEIYTVANAISTVNEANAMTGLTNNGLTTFQSVAAESFVDGDYMAQYIDTSPNGRIEFNVTLENATIYKIEFWGKTDVFESGRAWIWEGFEATGGVGYDGWTGWKLFGFRMKKYTVFLKTNSTTCTFRFYTTESASVNYVDNFSIKKVL